MTPHVDVLLPVFNCARYLEECLDSLIDLTYPNYNVIILDDGSTDGSCEILGRYAERYSIIEIHRNTKNQGILASRNRLLALSNAKYAAFMDADDICQNDRLQKQINFLTKHPDHIAVGSSCKIIGKKQSIIQPSVPAEIRAHMMITNAVCNSSVMVRLDRIKEKSIFCDKSFRGAADYKMWLDCSNSEYKVANIPEFLLRYRVHDEQESTKNSMRQKASHIRIVQSQWESHGLIPDSHIVFNLLWNKQTTSDELRDIECWIESVFINYFSGDSVQDHYIKSLLLKLYLKNNKIRGITSMKFVFKCIFHQLLAFRSTN